MLPCQQDVLIQIIPQRTTLEINKTVQHSQEKKFDQKPKPQSKIDYRKTLNSANKGSIIAIIF